MKQELYYISPRVVATGTMQEIAIKGKFPHSDLRGFQGEFTIDSVRADGLFTNNEIPGFTSGNGFDLGRPDYEEIKDVSFDADGVLRFRYPFAGEGENYFRVRIADRVLFVFGIFSIPSMVESERQQTVCTRFPMRLVMMKSSSVIK